MGVVGKCLWDLWWPSVGLHSYLILILLCSATCCCSVCAVVLVQTPSASLVVPSLFYGRGFSIRVRRLFLGSWGALTCCTLGCRLPVAGSAGECLGSTWAHRVLWAVLSCWEQVLLRNVFCESPGCTVLWLCSVGCACPFLRAGGCHCVLWGAVN